MYHSANRTIFAIFVVALFSVTPALATSIAPGVDLFAAVAGDGFGNGSQWDFSSMPIPADFFWPGSDPFNDLVPLEGNPSGPGNIDTRVQRLDGINPFNFPDGPQTIDIEIVELSLTSVDPITVSINSGASTELWYVEMDLSGIQPTGGMDVDHSQTNGGTFDATVPVQPLFTFTRVSNPIDVRVLDTVAEGVGPFHLGTPTPEPWVHTMLPGDMHSAAGVPAGDFYPGVAPPVIFNSSGSRSQLVYNAATPEPATMLLLALGVIPTLLRKRRKK